MKRLLAFEMMEKLILLGSITTPVIPAESDPLPDPEPSPGPDPGLNGPVVPPPLPPSGPIGPGTS